MTPWTVARQAPESQGFSRQEYWSGLPCLPPGKLPNPGIKPRSPTLQADYLQSESPEKTKNTGVGNLFLLQGIFPAQELNQDVLHCRQILYQLSRFSGVQPFAFPCTVACQAPLFMRFSTQEYWSGLDMPAPRVSVQPRNRVCISCFSCIEG